MSKSWKPYAVGEGLTKVINNSLGKVVGLAGGTFGTSIFVVLIMGTVQMFGGLLIAIVSGQKIFPGWKLVGGSVLFGTVAAIISIAGLYAFTFEEADLGIFVFISLFGLLPGVFIDWAFFKTPLTSLQWLAVGVFLFGGYGMLDFPSLTELLSLPPWILIAFIVPVGVALNEGITRGISQSKISNPFVNNFWIGMTSITISASILIFVNPFNILSTLPIQFYVLPVFMGFVTLTMISLKLLAYKAGGTIAFKKIVMQGTHLIAAILVGLLFFGEVITFGKIVGISAFLISMFLMERKTI